MLKNFKESRILDPRKGQLLELNAYMILIARVLTAVNADRKKEMC